MPATLSFPAATLFHAQSLESAHQPQNLNTPMMVTKTRRRRENKKMRVRCTYQKYSNLERHLHFGKCKLVAEKHTLLDQAILSYVEKVQEDATSQPTLQLVAKRLETLAAFEDNSTRLPKDALYPPPPYIQCCVQPEMTSKK